MVRTTMRRRATNQLAAAIGMSCITFALVTQASGQCTPTWDRDFVTTGVGVSQSVDAFVEFNAGSGKGLYAAGGFTVIDGLSAGGGFGFARWDGQQWTPKAVGFTSNPINALAVFDDGTGPAIYAGGAFTTIGGVSANQIARYDHVNDTWQPVGGGLNMDPFLGVEVLIVYNDGANPGLYALGRNPGGGLNPRIERWDGTSWTNFGVGANMAAVNAAVVFDGGAGNELYVAGSHPTQGGVVRRWNGVSWTSVGTNLGSSVFAIAAFNGELYVGTSCPNGSDIGQCIRRYDGSTWSFASGASAFNISTSAGPSPAVRALHVADDGTGPALFAGGQMVNTSPLATNIARWDGTNWSPLTFGVFSIVSGQIAGVVQEIYGYNDGTGAGVYVGGTFNSAQNNDGMGGILSRGIARWGCFNAITVDPDESDLVASATVISSFGGQTSIIVTPRDANGDLLPPGRDVVINATAGTLLGSVADLGDGTYRQELAATIGDSGALVTATVDGVAINASASITFVAVDPVASTIEVNPDQMLAGFTALITVTPTDDNGVPVGSGLNVVINTTHGDLLGSVSDNGDGTYTQSILALSVGTASITATVNGLVIDASAALSVLDPSAFGDIVSVNANGDISAHLSIQDAIDASSTGSWTIFVVPGVYNETLQFTNRSNIHLIGLAAGGEVRIRGAVFDRASNITLSDLSIYAGCGPHDAVHLRGGPKSSENIAFYNCTVTGAMKNGFAIDRDNENVHIEGCTIINNGRNGIECHLSGGPYTVVGSTISGNGYNGVSLGRDVVMTLIENVITNNGLANGQGGGRWGIDRDRKPHSGTPQQVTLILNVITGNHGKPKAGSADANVNNYDQIIDATDNQPPYN
ncbi:MAG TPA: invasin domain 3-containing protein [Phycisphaerales bacterium]|nr:invasin domain 3-containing protein [Phycisphaerales bacterium]